MYKWNISNGSVQMIEDPLTREDFLDDFVVVDQAEQDKLKEIESHMTMAQADSVPKIAILQIQVG